MIDDPVLVQNSAVDFFSNLMQSETSDLSIFNDALIPGVIST